MNVVPQRVPLAAGPVVMGPATVEVGFPNNTLYIQNLDESVRTSDMKSQLREWFKPYGTILEIYVKKRLALKGQAFIIFDDLESARKALEANQGRRLYGKSMVIKYARFKSDLVSKRDGTFESERMRRETDKAERAKRPRITLRQRMAQMMNKPGGVMMFGQGQLGRSSVLPGQASMTFGAGGEIQLPNKILFIQNLPPSATEDRLVELFKGFMGFLEVRMVPSRPDVAFVEYQNENLAAVVQAAMDKFEISSGSIIRVSFAKR